MLRDRLDWRRHSLFRLIILILFSQFLHGIFIQLVFSEDLSKHLFFLNLNNHVNFTCQVLNNIITRSIKMKKLLEIFQSMPKFRFVNKRELIKLFKYPAYILIYLIYVELNFMKAFFHLFVQIFHYLRMNFYIICLQSSYLRHNFL